MPNVKFFTLGCKVNQYDTQSIREQFLRSGCCESNSLPADVCVINTCTVTHKTDAQSRALIRKAARDNPGALMVVTGCLAQTDARRLRKEVPQALIVSNRDKHSFVQRMMKQHFPGVMKKLNRDSPYLIEQGISFFQGRTRAFLKIQDGCDNHCSYCKVPLARGLSRSKAPELIIEEVSRLCANGYKEIVLCGVCLGSYGKDLAPRITLDDTLARLERVPGCVRIRLSSIEAGDITPSLIARIAASTVICKHLHIPLQSGDDAVLKAMHRTYSRQRYLALVRRIRKSIPDIALTTDILVGFPGETQKQFENTARLIEQIKPLGVHVFAYSRRERTPAAAIVTGIVAPAVAHERSKRVSHIAKNCARQYLMSRVGKMEEVLFEEKIGGSWIGHSSRYCTIRVASRKDLRNVCARVLVHAVEGTELLGTLA